MRVPHRPLRAGSVALLGLATVALTGALAAAQTATAATSATSATSANSATSAGSPRLAAVKGSLTATTDTATGAHTAAQMSVEVALAPRDEAGLSQALTAVYTEDSGQYHHWLAKGQFDASYAPSAAERAAVEGYLRGQGLTVSSTDSPFLVSATGSSARITAALHTTLSNYVSGQGVRFYANSTAVSLPSSIVGDVQGVIGLTDTVRLHSLTAKPTAKPTASTAAGQAAKSCETGYVTTKELFAYANNGTNYAVGYGGGPDCSGLTPAQTNSIYGAPAASPSTQGNGVYAAVFELSAYRASDIDTWAHYFYGSGYKPSLTNITIDGGPLAPLCPATDTCPADANGYSGDIEVDADIEQEMAVAKDAHILVYDAPNDETGQTELDEYTAIADEDIASTVSSSWGECENDAGQGFAEAENTVFEQMALQGQSMFAAAGDDGAFDCLDTDGTSVVNVDDPGSQPWVTSVGGTSLESDNPGANSHPGYPAAGTETVWNPDNLCSDHAKAAANDKLGGYYWCGDDGVGAGGGGSSKFWGALPFQRGPGVTSKYTTYSPTSCVLASGIGTPCRQVPDVSADADEYTGYAEYCTGTAKTAYSDCATFPDGGGWFMIGGTSLSTPLWGALITDRDSDQGSRTGNINPLVYAALDSNPSRYFNDITGTGKLQQAATNNGLFPTTPGYDEATGAGTPKFAAIITTR
jgi:subtilase family serine protease